MAPTIRKVLDFPRSAPRLGEAFQRDLDFAMAWGSAPDAFPTPSSPSTIIRALEFLEQAERFDKLPPACKVAGLDDSLKAALEEVGRIAEEGSTGDDARSTAERDFVADMGRWGDAVLWRDAVAAFTALWVEHLDCDLVETPADQMQKYTTVEVMKNVEIRRAIRFTTV